MLKKIALITAATVLCTANAYALRCNDMDIVIKNNSSDPWNVVVQNKHGYVKAKGNPVLAKGETSTIETKGYFWFYGPDAVVTLKNGDRTETVRAQQNRCVFEAGNINSYSDPAKFVRHQKDEVGSFADSRQGKTYYTIED